MEKTKPMKTSTEAEHLSPRFNYIVNTGELSVEALKNLECPGCHKITPPPIYLCELGHSICNECVNTLESCPKCGNSFTQMRNDLAESLISKLLFKCPNWKSGCKFASLGGNELEKHLEECCFGQIVCIIGSGIGCRQVIPLNEYEAHLKEVHNVGGVENPEAIINMSTSVNLGSGNWTFPPHYLKAFGKTFLCFAHASYNLLLFWISLCDADDEVPKYAGSVTVFHPEKKYLQTKWTGPVHRIHATPNEIYDSGNCLALIPESFLLFADITFDNNERKLINWKCLFEIMDLSNPGGTKTKAVHHGCGCIGSESTSSADAEEAATVKSKSDQDNNNPPHSNEIEIQAGGYLNYDDDSQESPDKEFSSDMEIQ